MDEKRPNRMWFGIVWLIMMIALAIAAAYWYTISQP
jgi:hypothetical protein